jgi:hypothetical protein
MKTEDFEDAETHGENTTNTATGTAGSCDGPAVLAPPTPSVGGAVAEAMPAAPPGMKLVDPFAQYAANEGGEAFFEGDYVKLDQERGWTRGQKKESISATEAFVANMHEARHGWIKFAKGDGEGVARRTELILERPELPPCPACGDIADEHDDKRCEWRPTVYLPLRSVTDPSDVVCFTGTGKGARKAVAQLCRTYARPGADRKGKSPAITLSTWSFDNKSGGTTTWPVFKLIGWEFFVPGQRHRRCGRSWCRSRRRPNRAPRRCRSAVSWATWTTKSPSS